MEKISARKILTFEEIKKVLRYSADVFYECEEKSEKPKNLEYDVGILSEVISLELLIYLYDKLSEKSKKDFIEKLVNFLNSSK